MIEKNENKFILKVKGFLILVFIIDFPKKIL